jgi:carbon starvation protein
MGATALMCFPPLAMLWVADAGSYRSFWTLFGTSNQLLAALSLLTITVWLRRSGRNFALALVPALFVLAVTLTALVLQLGQAFATGASWIARWNGLVSAALLGLAGLLLITTAREVRRTIPGHPAASPAAPS